MSTWPAFFTALFFVSIAAACGAAIAIPFVYRRGMRQIDHINWRIDHEAEARQSASNVRVLSQYERNAKWQKVRRNREGGVS